MVSSLLFADCSLQVMSYSLVSFGIESTLLLVVCFVTSFFLSFYSGWISRGGELGCCDLQQICRSFILNPATINKLDKFISLGYFPKTIFYSKNTAYSGARLMLKKSQNNYWVLPLHK
jgi:hypothetical protein